MGDPWTRNGAVFTTNGSGLVLNAPLFSINGPASTWQGTLDQGGIDTIGHYDGIFGSTLLLSGMVGQHREKVQYGGPGSTTPEFLNQTVSPTQTSGGFPAYDNQNFRRNVVKGDLTQYWGSHTIKAGGDYEDITATVDRFEGGGGQRVYELQSGSTIYYRHRYYVNDLAAGFSRTDPSTWQILDPLIASPQTTNGSLYAQDSYKPLSNVTVNFGLRWERQHVLGRDATAGFALNDNWAPRVGVVWDPTKAGKAKVYFNYGRFYESIPQDINIRSFGGETQAFAYNLSPDPSNTTPMLGLPSKNSLLGGSSEAVDPALKGQYINEWIGGFEYEAFTEHERRHPRDLPESWARDRGLPRPFDRRVFHRQPGRGHARPIARLLQRRLGPRAQSRADEQHARVLGTQTLQPQLAVPCELRVPKLDGNYDGTFQQSTGQLDPNINSAFDYADFMVNSQGELSNEHKHQLKLDGNYVVLGRRARAGSAWRLVPLAVRHAADRVRLLVRLRELGVLPDAARLARLWAVRLRGRPPPELSDQARKQHEGNVVMDVFNILNRQAPTMLDQRYNLSPDPPCGGIPAALCNGDGGLVTNPGTLTPVSQLANARASATNPDFLKAGTFFTLPRSARIGVRFTF